MYELTSVSADNKKEFYKELSSMLAGLISDETDGLPMLPCSIPLYTLPEINWQVFTSKRPIGFKPCNGKPLRPHPNGKRGVRHSSTNQ